MDTDELSARLRDGERFAPDLGPVLAEVGRARQVRQIRHRRRLVVRVGAIAAAVVVIAVAGTTALVGRPQTPARPPASITATTPVSAPASIPATAPVSATALVTAADLATYRWSTMPAAPIRDRDQAAMVWTGAEMIVWGGVADDGKTDVADGAAYNPTTQTWRVLPASPLDARIPQASVWTGAEFIVWGGDHGQTDGAAYDPATNSWRVIPAVPGATALGGTAEMPTGAVAAWTGDVVQLLTWRYQGTAVQSWYYSPSRNAWSAGRPIQPKSDAQISDVGLLARAADLDAFVGWSYADASGGVHDEVTAYARTGADSRWHIIDYPGLQRVGPLADAGAEIFLGGGQPTVGFHSAPASMVPGQRLDPTNATSITMPGFPGVVDLGDYAIAWTGAALLGYGSDSYVEDPDGTKHLPGAAAAWDPATNAWTVLPSAPSAPYGTVSGVWTGTELLSWGLMYPANQVNTDGKQVQATGLIFGPAS